MKIDRPDPIVLVVQGNEYVIAAISRAQVRAAAALDPTDPTTETATQADERRAKQLRILGWPEPASPWEIARRRLYGLIRRDPPGLLPLRRLTADEEGEILFALYGRHLGFDPAEAVATRRVVKKKDLVTMLAAIGSGDSTTTPATSPSPSAAI